MSKLTEGDMISYVIGFLTGRGYKVWRQPNYGYFDRSKFLTMFTRTNDLKLSLDKSYAKVYGTLRGVPDVVGFHLERGTYIGVEIKIGEDKLSEEQRDFLNTLHFAKGEAYLAKTPEQFAEDWTRKNQDTIY